MPPRAALLGRQLRHQPLLRHVANCMSPSASASISCRSLPRFVRHSPMRLANRPSRTMSTFVVVTSTSTWFCSRESSSWPRVGLRSSFCRYVYIVLWNMKASCSR